jgi:hypothetical protein
MSLYMFRALNAHLQEDTLYKCSIWYCHALQEFVVACRRTVHRQATTNSRRVILDHSPVYRVTVPYAACIQYILLNMGI